MMRHWFGQPCAVVALTCCMGQGALARALVLFTRALQAFTPALLATTIETIEISPVAVTAKAHQAAASGTEILAVTFLRQQRRLRSWTKARGSPTLREVDAPAATLETRGIIPGL